MGAGKIPVVTIRAAAFLNIEFNMDRLIDNWQFYGETEKSIVFTICVPDCSASGDLT